MIIQLVTVWAIAIFGFQILLKIIEKPVPEAAYTVYKQYWDGVTAGEMDTKAMQEVGKSALSVLGKVAITPEYRLALDNAVSWMAYNIADSSQKAGLVTLVGDFEKLSSETEVITDNVYVQKKNEVIPVLSSLFDIAANDVRGRIAPLEVKTSLMESFDKENVLKFEEAMDLYLIHNRSVLTDTRFLGFPFHYFYTAVFLLILFVGLCWLYCVRTDMFNKKYSIED